MTNPVILRALPALPMAALSSSCSGDISETSYGKANPDIFFLGLSRWEGREAHLEVVLALLSGVLGRQEMKWFRVSG